MTRTVVSAALQIFRMQQASFWDNRLKAILGKDAPEPVGEKVPGLLTLLMIN